MSVSSRLRLPFQAISIFLSALLGLAMPACVDGGFGSGGDAADAAWEKEFGPREHRSAGPLCDAWANDRTYDTGEKIWFNGKPYEANRHVHQNTPPIPSDYEWFWSEIDPSECGDVDPGDGDLADFMASLSPEAHATAQGLRRSADGLDIDALIQQADNQFSQARSGGGEHPANAVNAQTPEVGSIPGKLTVGNGGEVQYTIPIKAPPGRRKMTPGLSLNYSSSRGVSQLGFGWDLSKPAMIKPCQAWNGIKAGGEHPSEQAPRRLKPRLCYGGSPLLPPEGEDPELTYGRHFRTAQDNFSEFDFDDDSAGKWKAYTKSGEIQTFERPKGARSSSDFFVLTQRSDRYGNKIFYNYAEENRGDFSDLEDDDEKSYVSLTLTSIEYMEGTRRLDFEYERLEHPFMTSAANNPGYAVPFARRLVKLSASVDNRETWHYNFHYESGTTTQHTRLRSVEICDPDGRCMPSTDFTYAEVDLSESADTFAQEINLFSFEEPDERVKMLGQTIRDVNNDGRDDLIWLEEVETRKYALKYALGQNSNTTPLGPTQSVQSPLIESLDRFTFPDAYGRGTLDILVLEDNGDLLRFNLFDNEPTGTSVLPSWHDGFLYGANLDVNGDGFIDFVGCEDRRPAAGTYDEEYYTWPAEELGTWGVWFGGPNPFTPVKISPSQYARSTRVCVPSNIVGKASGTLSWDQAPASEWADIDTAPWGRHLKSIHRGQLLYVRHTDFPSPGAPGGISRKKYPTIELTNGLWSNFVGVEEVLHQSDSSLLWEEIERYPNFKQDWIDYSRQRSEFVSGVSGEFNYDGHRDVLDVRGNTTSGVITRRGVHIGLPAHGPAREALRRIGKVSADAFEFSERGKHWGGQLGKLPTFAFDWNEDGITDVLAPRWFEEDDEPPHPHSALTTNWVLYSLQPGWGDSSVRVTHRRPLRHRVGGPRKVCPTFPRSFGVTSHVLSHAEYNSTLYFEPIEDEDEPDPNPDSSCKSGTFSFKTADFNGDGRKELLRFYGRSDNPFQLGASESALRKVYWSDRLPTTHAGGGKPLIDRLISVRDGLGKVTEVDYLPFSDERMQASGDDAMQKCHWREDDCEAIPLAPRGVGVWRLREGVSALPEHLVLHTEYQYGNRFRSASTGTSLGFTKIIAKKTQGGRLTGAVIKEFASLEQADYPSDLDLDAVKFPLIGKPRRQISISSLVATDTPNYPDRVRFRVSEERFAYSLLKTQNLSGSFETTYHTPTIASFHAYGDTNELHPESTLKSILHDWTTIRRPHDRVWDMSEICGAEDIANSLNLENGSSWPILTTDLEDIVQVDRYGNTLCTRARQSDGASTEIITDYITDAIAIASWQVGLPQRISKSSNAANNPSPGIPEPSDRAHITEFSYYDEDSGVNNYFYGIPFTTTIAPGDPTREQSTQYRFDSYGNITETTVRARDYDGGWITPRVSVADYGDEHQFPEYTESGGLWVKTKFNRSFGFPVMTLLKNGCWKSANYDSHGRESFSHNHCGRPDGALGQTNYTYFEPVEYDSHGKPSYTIRRETHGQGYIKTRFDRMNRKLWEEWTGFEGELRSKYYRYGATLDANSISTPQIGPGQEVPNLGIDWTIFERNGLGQVVREIRPDGYQRTSKQWVENGHYVSRSQDEFATTHAIADVSQNIIATIDGLHNQRCFKYGANGQLSSTWMLPEGSGGSHNTCGNRPGLPGHTLREYDDYGHMTAENDPESGRKEFEYNALGELRRSVDARGIELFFEYDDIGRETAIHRPEGTTSYEWDTFMPGFISVVREPTRTTTLVHDNGGRVRQKLVLDQNDPEPGDFGQVFTYYFDNHTSGNITAATYPQSGSLGHRPKIRYEYDGIGNLKSVFDDIYNYRLWTLRETNRFDQPKHEGFGQIGQPWEQNDHATTWRDYDILGRVERIQTLTPGAQGWLEWLQHLEIGRDSLGRVTDRLNPRTWHRETYDYDPVGRLESRNIYDGWFPRSSEEYDYDQFGNITYRSSLGDFSYNARGENPRQLTNAGDKAFSYDQAGNQTQRGGSTLTYDSYSQISSITRENGSYIEMSYDAEGVVRHRYDQESQKESFYVDDSYWKEYSFQSGTLNATHHYLIPGLGRDVAELVIGSDGWWQTPFAKLSFLHPNDQGSVELVTRTDEWGRASAMSWTPFGRARNPDAIWDEDFVPPRDEYVTAGFTGHRRETNTDLISMGARHLDPITGRFTSPDEITPNALSTQSWAKYSYVKNDPVNLIDPSGNAEKLPDTHYDNIVHQIVVVVEPATTDPTEGTVADGGFGDLMRAMDDVEDNELFNNGPGDYKPDNLPDTPGDPSSQGQSTDLATEVAKEVGTVAVDLATDFIPGVSTVKGAYELYEDTKKFVEKPSWLGFAAVGLSLVGLVPGGKIVKSPGKLIKAAKSIMGVVKKIPIPGRAGKKLGCFEAGTEIATEDGPTPIEDVELGSRVKGDFEICQEPIPDDWTRFAAVIPGTRDDPENHFYIEQIRPTQWVTSNDVTQGAKLWLDFEELGISGWADIHEVEHGFPVQKGPGCLVTSTFRHESLLLPITLEGQIEPLRVTERHPLFSDSRNRWIAAGDLRPGEVLKTLSGRTTVTAIGSVSSSKEAVFNLEIKGAHVYYVGKNRTLAHNSCGKTYQTYTKTNPKTGEVYTGRTSGKNTPEQNVGNRDRNHHMNDKGFGPAVLDKSTSNKKAIRGREQQMIDAHGGAKSTGGTSGNAINGISKLNPKRQGYLNAATAEFGN